MGFGAADGTGDPIASPSEAEGRRHQVQIGLAGFQAEEKAEGGEVYAATASQGMVRFVLAVGSEYLARDPSYQAVNLDGTQAFTHADMEDEVYIRILPRWTALRCHCPAARCGRLAPHSHTACVELCTATASRRSSGRSS